MVAKENGEAKILGLVKNLKSLQGPLSTPLSHLNNYDVDDHQITDEAVQAAHSFFSNPSCEYSNFARVLFSASGQTLVKKMTQVVHLSGY